MSECHLSNEEFLDRLTDLFKHRKDSDHGAIYLVQKRLSYGQGLPSPTDDAPFPDLHPAQPLPTLVRATNGQSRKARIAGQKIKLSTVVQPGDLDHFYTRYADVCKAGMTTLKPRDKNKKKAKARKKKTAANASAATNLTVATPTAART